MEKYECFKIFQHIDFYSINGSFCSRLEFNKKDLTESPVETINKILAFIKKSEEQVIDYSNLCIEIRRQKGTVG